MKTNSATNAIPEANKAVQAASNYFARSAVHTLAVIEKSEDGNQADVSVFTRDGGRQITVQLPVTDDDRLEYGAEKLAYRLGTRPAVIYADQELLRAE